LKHHHAFLREIVEIKNSCPFDAVTCKSGARGRVKKEWVVCDRGPRSHLSPSWVPQMQLHMAATGTWSGLLVTRSPRGVYVYRMYRDDEYLYRMCCLIKR
jgi:radial spoke head protein 9